jgi:ATP-dependent exoDNAse (exonuclease V) alpha subunit
MKLNESQEIAGKEIKRFFNNLTSKYHLLVAPPGYGKTYLINALQVNKDIINGKRKLAGVPEFEDIIQCAATNKAASHLNEGETVHRVFQLIVWKNPANGQRVLKQRKNAETLKNQIIIIDESSMLDDLILGYIEKHTENCKIVFVLDDAQLKSVSGAEMPVLNKGYGRSDLTIPERFDKDSDLFATCMKLREAVLEGKSHVLEECDGIRFVDEDQFKLEMVNSVKNGEDSKVLTYTNKGSIGLNKFVRAKLGHPAEITKGDTVVIRNFCFDATGEKKSRVDRPFEVTHTGQRKVIHNVDCLEVDIDGKTFLMPLDRQLWLDAINSTRNSKEWAKMFALQEGVADIRYDYSCTIHCAQGSTFDTAYVNYQDLNKCQDEDTFRRLVNVACSRARKEVVLYGL